MPNPKGINQYSKGGKGVAKKSGGSRRSKADQATASAIKTVEAHRSMASRATAGSSTAGTGKKSRARKDKNFESALRTVEASRRLLGK